MKNKLIVSLITGVTLLGACNRAFLPKKSTVLRVQDGYLFDMSDKELFIPTDIKQDFLHEVNGSKAYKIAGSRETRSPIYLERDSLKINIHFNIDGEPKDTFSMQEKIYISRVRITYAPFEITRHAQSEPIGFDYQGKYYSFISYNFFEGNIYRINALDSAGNIIGLSFH